jgi:hypothetical protein
LVFIRSSALWNDWTALDQHPHFLPRAFAVGDVDPRLIAVDLQARRVVERRDAELPVEVVLLESVLADAEHEPHQPFHRRVRVEEPALGLDLSGDLDNRRLLPVRFAELAVAAHLLFDPQ